MKRGVRIGVGAVAVLGGAAAIGFAMQRHAMAEAERAYSSIASGAAPPAGHFDPQQIGGLPEIAQRYFRHAIAPGTPLYSSAELTMGGSFLLGDRRSFQTYRMRARQVLGRPGRFVWIPSLASGMMTITGSDGLFEGRAWTRFWLLGLIPVANEQTSPDLVRSAHFRAAVETAIWLPPSLLPGNGVEWEQLDADRARVTFRRVDPAISIVLTLDAAGAVKEVVGQRWSNANPQKKFRLQPFGGVMLAESTFGGLTVPSRMAVGNHFGTPDYLPFFQARILTLRYR